MTDVLAAKRRILDEQLDQCRRAVPVLIRTLEAVSRHAAASGGSSPGAPGSA